MIAAGMNFLRKLFGAGSAAAAAAVSVTGATGATTAAVSGTAAGTFLHGERDIIDGDLQLCLAEPDNVVPRIILAQTLRWMKAVRPQVVAEFRDKVLLLQKEKPLTAPAQGVLQRLFTEVYP
jgi:hypothetical protein